MYLSDARVLQDLEQRSCAGMSEVSMQATEAMLDLLLLLNGQAAPVLGEPLGVVLHVKPFQPCSERLENLQESSLG